MNSNRIGYCDFSLYRSNSHLGYPWVSISGMVGLDQLVLVPHIFLCVAPPADNMFVPLVSNLGFPLSRYVDLFRIWTFFLLLDGGYDVGVGAAVQVYSLWPGSCVFGVDNLC